MYILYVWNVWFCGEIEYPKLGKFNGKLGPLYIYGMSGFAEKLNSQNYLNSKGNFVQYMYGLSGFAEKLNIQNFVNSSGICVHFISMECLALRRNWISKIKKIQWEIVSILYVRNVRICREIKYPVLFKFNGKLFTLYVRNMWIYREIEYPELLKFKGKLCTLNVWTVWICR